MKPTLVRAGAAALAVVSVMGVAAWGPRKAPPPPPVIEAPPPPPPTSLSASVVQAAAAYEDYVNSALKLSAKFSDAAQVQSELKLGESYEPTQLAHGMVALSAVVALQDPTFVAGVKAYAKDPAGRQQLINLIYADPRYAAQIPGASSAAARVLARLTSDGAALQKAGEAMKQSARDVQHQSWSKENVADREGRLAIAKQLGGTPLAPSAAESEFLLRAAVSGSGLDTTPVQAPALVAVTPASAPGTSPAAAQAAGSATNAQPPYTEGVNRGLAIAALAVLGGAGDNNATQVSSLMDENIGHRCLDLAKMNHYQCLAVARPHYEDVFCLGQHALAETGRCVQKVAGTASAEVLEVTAMDAAKAAKEAAAKEKAAKRAAAHHRKGRKS